MSPNLANKPGQRPHLRDYMQIIQKRRWILITVFIVLVTTVAIDTFRMEPIYRATTTILIEKENPTVVNIQEIMAINAADTDYYQTQYKILESESLAQRVIDRLSLRSNPDFNPPPETGFHPLAYLSGVINSLLSPKGTANSPAKILSAEDKLEAKLIGRFLKNLQIEPVRNSRLVGVSFESTDPALAARVANSLAENYTKMILETRFAASTEATAWLTQNLEGLKKKVEDSERALQEFMNKERIISVPTLEKAERISENIVAQRLSELNTEVTKAKAGRIALETMIRELQGISGNPDMMEAIPAAIDNRLIQELKAVYARLYGEYSLLSEKYGPKHPKIVQLHSQLTELKDNISQEVSKIARSLETQYKSALAREQTLLTALEAQKQEALDLNKKVIRYGILKREVEGNKQMYENFLMRLKETSVTAGLKTSNIRVIDPAKVPERPVKPRVMLNLLLAIISGLTLGTGLAFFYEYLDNTLRTPEDIENFLQIPSLGVIGIFQTAKGNPGGEELITLSDPRSNISEAFRNLRTNVLYSSYDPPRKLILITSALPIEGKTLVAANLAAVLALTGRKVLLLDTDMRKPRLHKLFEVERQPGIAQYLIGEAEPNQIIRETRVANLKLAPCGDIPPNPSELLGSERMISFLSENKDQFDYILLDSAPLVSVTDALVLAGQMDGIILIIKGNETARDPVRRSLRQLEEVKAKVLGAVLNQVDLKKEGYYYHYYRYYRPYGTE